MRAGTRAQAGPLTDILNVDITPGCLIAVAVWSKDRKPTLVVRTVVKVTEEGVWFCRGETEGREAMTSPDRVVVVSNLEATK